MRHPRFPPDSTSEIAFPSKLLRIVASLPHLAALLVVAAGLGASHAAALEPDSGDRAVPWDPKFSTPLNDPRFPVLPGGVVGPALDAGTGSAMATTLPDAARDTAGNVDPTGRQAPLVPPPAETWEQAVESYARLTGEETSNEIDDGQSQRRRVGIALGLVGAIGILAVLAAVRGANPRMSPQTPLSVIRSRAPDTPPTA